MTRVFDNVRVLRQRQRSHTMNHPSKYFLFDWASDQLVDRLSIIKRNFETCIQLGFRGKDVPPSNSFFIRTSDFIAPSKHNSIVCDCEFLPFARNSIDLITSSLDLHMVDDLPGCLLQIRQSLKPDGLFLAAILGGETLFELRDCLTQAELEISGGVTPRVSPFADKQQMGALLQRAGFSLPVVDSNIITVTYESLFTLMQDLRRMGEGNAILNRTKKFTSKSLFLRAAALYAQKYADPDGRIRASFEVIFLTGWAPHNSQQKPLKPGSAQTRLADHLGTQEIGSGEKTH